MCKKSNNLVTIIEKANLESSLPEIGSMSSEN
jgi:hypothetical protein